MTESTEMMKSLKMTINKMQKEEKPDIECEFARDNVCVNPEYFEICNRCKTYVCLFHRKQYPKGLVFCSDTCACEFAECILGFSENPFSLSWYDLQTSTKNMTGDSMEEYERRCSNATREMLHKKAKIEKKDE